MILTKSIDEIMSEWNTIFFEVFREQHSHLDKPHPWILDKYKLDARYIKIFMESFGNSVNYGDENSIKISKKGARTSVFHHIQELKMVFEYGYLCKFHYKDGLINIDVYECENKFPEDFPSAIDEKYIEEGYLKLDQIDRDLYENIKTGFLYKNVIEALMSYRPYLFVKIKGGLINKNGKFKPYFNESPILKYLF